MTPSVLTDKNIFPTEELIVSRLGRSKACWLSFTELIHKQHPDFVEEWRYYKDGKCWLMKVLRKKKTMFWLSIIPKAFRITFYFTKKAKEQILESTLSDEVKSQFINGRQYNKIRGVTVVCRNRKDIASAALLLEIKSSLL